MRRFIFKTIFFLVPIGLVLLPPLIILKGTGENFTDIDPIIKNNPDYLIGYVYNERNYKYVKWATINEHNTYDVIALGSSRSLTFRAGMFESSFYNAGYAILRIGDFQKFLEGLPEEKYPKYLIMNFDQWMFNDNWDNGEGKKISSDFWANSFSKYPKFSVLVSVYEDLFEGKYGFKIISNKSSKKKIGLNANVNNRGFRNDGSMYYGTHIHKLLNNDKSVYDYKFSDTFHRIKKGIRRFEHGDKINPIAVERLDQLLAYCKKYDIHVIGFIPPFADAVYEQMVSSNKYAYLNDLSDKLAPVFTKYEYEFYNYPSLKFCNSTDDENVDGFHCGEVVYCNMLIDMLKNNSILNEVTSIEKLEADKKNKVNRYIVYE